MDMNDTLAIKIFPADKLPAKVCIALKNLTGLSLGEIKERAEKDEFLFICDYADDDGLKLINKIKREMKKFKIPVKLYEDGEEKSSELFDNIEKLHEEINAQYDDFEDEF